MEMTFRDHPVWDVLDSTSLVPLFLEEDCGESLLVGIENSGNVVIQSLFIFFVLFFFFLFFVFFLVLFLLGYFSFPLMKICVSPLSL